MVVSASYYGDVFFSLAGNGKLVRTEGMMDGPKYWEILEKTRFESFRELRLGTKVQLPANNPKHSVKATLKWFNTKYVNVLE